MGVEGREDGQDSAEAARVAAVNDALEAVRRGDEAAMAALFAELYDELRELAHRQRRRWSGNHTIDTTALVHESYLKLVDKSRFQWKDLGHFFAVACKAMRHILVDYARGQKADKRGGGQQRLALDDAELGRAARQETMSALGEALDRLTEADPRRATVFEMRFFLGSSVEEIAELLGLSPATVKRDWALATSFVRMCMEG